MRCRDDSKPVAVSECDDGDIHVEPLPFVVMTDEQLDRAAAILARLLRPIAEDIVREREARTLPRAA